MIVDRLRRLRQSLTKQDFDVLLVSKPANRRYLSGFTGSTGWLFISASRAVLSVDFRYVEQAKQETPDFEIVHIRGDVTSWLPKLVSDIGGKKVGFEADQMLFSTYQQLCNNTSQMQFVPITGLVEHLRMVKDTQELDLIAKAVNIADKAIDHAKSVICPGKTEKDIAWELEKFLREQGSETLPFDVIVASGSNSALPHARPSGKHIFGNEPIVIDIGARINGYCSDLSRTLYLGNKDKTFSKIYDTVLGAQLTGLATIISGMSGYEADKLSRTVIEQAGYGEVFGHGLGHGVGLETHEAPHLGPNSADILADGMVFTIEPGVYIPGWGGVRIEDTVVAENGKIRSLARADKIASIH